MKYFFIILLFICCSDRISIREEHPSNLIGKWLDITNTDSTFLEFSNSGHYTYQHYILPHQLISHEEGTWIVTYLDGSDDNILNGTEEKKIKLHVMSSNNNDHVGKITYVSYNYWIQGTGFLTIHLNPNNKLYFQEDTTTIRERL